MENHLTQIDEVWRFWKRDFSKSILVIWNVKHIPLKNIRKGIEKQVGKKFTYERNMTLDSAGWWFATTKGLTKIIKQGTCPECGQTMHRITIKKGTWKGHGSLSGSRGVYRFQCSCGHTYTECGDGNRERAINEGHFDSEIGILKPPTEE